MSVLRSSPVRVALAASVLGAAGIAQGAILTSASGTYDEQAVQANAVDKSATGTYALTVSTFASHVAAAYAANTGGVMHFDDVATPNANATNNSNESPFGTLITASYGTSQAKTFSLTDTGPFGSGTAGQVAAENGDPTRGTPISGAGTVSNKLFKSGGNGVDGNYRFTLSEPASEIGLTVLSRSLGGRTVTFTATLDDATTISTDAMAIAGADQTDDTFFGLAAPTGRTITAIVVNTGGTDFVHLDDIGFIVAVPEPASLGLLGAGGLLLLRRRR